MPQHQSAASPPSAQVTAAEISRIAGVTRATVSNWRRRHADFPAPSGGSDSSPLYNLTAVQDWLRERGQTSNASPTEDLRTALRLLGSRAEATRYFPLLSVARRLLAERTSDQFAELTDGQLTLLASQATAADSGWGAGESVDYGAGDAAVIRAVLASVSNAGLRPTLDVLAERELDESAASGTYQTPTGLADLIAGLLPAGTARILDPACGSGTLLVAAADHGARELYGQDTLGLQVQRAGVALALAESVLGREDTRVDLAVGDSLRVDAFPDVQVDAVLCNPPYGDRDWGHEELAYDARWAYGVPPRFESELAWVQHALAHVELGGHVVMLMPPAIAFRTSGRRIRTELLRGGALRAIVSLPARVAQPLHVALQIWILQRPDPGGPDRSSVLFIDASDEETGRGVGSGNGTAAGAARAAFDWPGLAARVVPLWAVFRDNRNRFADQPGFARAVSVVDLLDDVVDVTPARHVRATAADIDPAALARKVDDLYEELRQSAAALGEADSGGEWQSAGATVREWRSATVADLARGGALTLLKAVAVTASGRDSRGSSAGADVSAVGRPTLTVWDVASGGAPSGGDGGSSPEVVVGDVVVRAVAGGGVDGSMTRVADESDAGAALGFNLHLLRPDPRRLDPWFLAGFLGAADNISAASSGSTLVQVNPGRLRVPLMPLAEQRRYGDVFRHVHELRVQTRRTAEVAEQAAEAVTTGLTAGALLPKVPPDTQGSA